MMAETCFWMIRWSNDGFLMTSWLLITISDETLDPGEEALHPRVDAGSGVGTTGPVAHHSDQDKLAWKREDGRVFAVVEKLFRTKSKSFPENIFSPFSSTVRGPPLSPWQASVPWGGESESEYGWLTITNFGESKNGHKTFAKSVFAIFATNALFLRSIAKLQI